MFLAVGLTDLRKALCLSRISFCVSLLLADSEAKSTLKQKEKRKKEKDFKWNRQLVASGLNGGPNFFSPGPGGPLLQPLLKTGGMIPHHSETGRTQLSHIP